MSMYIRVKRRNQTVFLHVEQSSSFADIKKRLGQNFNMDSSSIMLYAHDKKRELVDMATVSDQEIKNDDVIYMVFQKEGAGGGWEDLQVDTLVPFGDDSGDHGPGTA